MDRLALPTESQPPQSQPERSSSPYSTSGDRRVRHSGSRAASSVPSNALDEFFVQIDNARRTSQIDDREFVLCSRVADWLRASPGNDPQNQLTNAERVLKAVYGDTFWDESTKWSLNPLLPRMRKEDEKCWLRTFAVLLLVGNKDAATHNLGKYIHRFFEQDKVDKHLAIAQSELKNIFFHLGLGETKAAKHFWDLQWQFCTQKAFHQPRNRIYMFKEMILPITKKVMRKQGGSGTIYIVEVPCECIPQSLAAKLHGKPYNTYDSDGNLLGQVHQFALKVLGHKASYHNETLAYRALENQDGIVQCFGDWIYSRSSSPRENEYHLLLEWGVYDLEEFFLLYPPQHTADGIVKFWEALSSIILALSKIHELVDGKDNWLGWHCDIKPGNILYCKSGHQRGWKIADPGYATFVLKDKAKLQDGVPVIEFKGGTTSYGAPELSQNEKTLISQRFDVWSLGCVFSEAATWVILGHRGVELFKHVRRSLQLGDDMSQDSTPLGSYQSVSSVASTKEFPASDCFHDGNEMSKTVSDWHKHLRHALRSSDPVTAKILDMVEDYMLQGDPAKRLDASQLATMIKAILTEAKSKVAEEINSGRGYKPPAYFQDAVDLEQEVEAAAVRERLTTRGDEPWRDKYKSQAFIDATKEPLGRLVEDLTYSSEYRRELVWDQSSIDDLRLRRGTTIPAGMPLHRGSSSTFRDARPQSIDDPRKTRIPSDILYANYSSARKLLDDAGWRPGALELPDYFHESHTPVSSSISLRTPVSPSPADGLFISEQPLPPLPLPKKSSGSDRSSLSLLKTTAGSWFSSKKRRSTVGTPVPRQVDVSVERPGPTVIQEPEGATADPLSPHHVISEEHRFDKFDVYFKKRDIAFLIDNGSSMDEYWLWAMDLVSVLVAFLYGQDDDGMELYFTSSRAPVGSFHEPKQFIEAMSRMKPKPRSRLGGSPSAPTPSALPPGSPFIMRTGTTSTTSSNQLDQEDIRESLAEILEQWGRKHAKKEKKKLTLIILTDGVWPGISKKETVANEIIRALEKWQDKVPLKEQLGSRGLSIQFVRFGDDPKAIEILDWMDNELSTMNGEQLPDIIDHEPATGNIYKMILGSLDSRYDEDDDNRTVRPEDGGSETYPTDADGEHGDIVSEVARSVHSRSGGSSQYIIHSGGAFDRTGPRQSQTFKV